MKIKNKRQGAMMKGIEAPAGSEHGGLISGSAGQWAGIDGSPL